MILRRTQPSLLLLMLCASLPIGAQMPGAAAPSAPASGSMPSAVLRPAIGSLRQALAILRPERWKAAGAVTAESTNDVGSIERDLDTTLPPLLSTADAASESPAQLLPAYRNVEALYDVLVRVTQTAVLAAPAQQSAALQQATAALQQGRRDFADLLDRAAQAQASQLRDAQARLRSIQSAPAPVTPVCAPPAPVKKAKPRVKPKPAAPSSGTSASQ
jgi:hypothetical protein